ncbi:hypothetical protein CAPTEDRAFT_197860 [Capitella teleta]|uniref:THAP-type domain-containing protein n=1 Tax=Capitella teleta TaxID=283909 RepID=R7TNX7_CAPTE|nr:hypothetical protein CAPTEDRAFT_197860 [Capitella teleta]|eukprot:ELT95598.1 hypothetical protein CAPTEDRAFT_197860 [Capitella teleta]
MLRYGLESYITSTVSSPKVAEQFLPFVCALRHGLVKARYNDTHYTDKFTYRQLFGRNRSATIAHKWWIFTRRSDKNFKNDKDRKSILQMVLCEEHFDKDQFKNPAQKGKPIKRKRLRGDALPLLFDVPNPPKQQTPSRPGPKRAADPDTPVQPSKRARLCTEGGDDAAPEDYDPLPFASPTSSQKASPSKEALKKMLSRYKKRWQREKKRKASSPKKMKEAEQIEVTRNLLKDHLSPDALNLVMAQIITKGRRRQRWSKEVKLYCLQLAYTSNAAYKFLRKSFKIPSIRTLQRIFEKMHIDTGFSHQLLNHLKLETAKMPNKDKYCTICFDEMALTAGLSYNRGHDIVKGFVDFANFGQSKKLGNHALVFMAYLWLFSSMLL